MALDPEGLADVIVIFDEKIQTPIDEHDQVLEELALSDEDGDMEDHDVIVEVLEGSRDCTKAENSLRKTIKALEAGLKEVKAELAAADADNTIPDEALEDELEDLEVEEDDDDAAE